MALVEIIDQNYTNVKCPSHRKSTQISNSKFQIWNVNDFLTHLYLVLQEELDVLRAKFEKIDKERQELRTQNEKLESRVCT